MEQHETGILAKLKTSTRWSAITELLSRLVAPVTSMVLSRLLTPEAFGVVATVTMVLSFADVCTDAGFQKYLVQHDFRDDKALDDATNVAFWTNLGLSLVLWGVIALFSDRLAEWVGNPVLGWEITVAALSLPLTAFSSIQMARFKRNFQFRELFFLRFATLFLPFVVTIPLAWTTHSHWALILGTLATNLANAVVLTVKSPWKPRPFFSGKLLREMLNYSWCILLESILVWLTSYIGVFIVGRVLSDYYLGLYKTAMNTVNGIIALITATTSMPLFSALSRLKEDEAEMNRTYAVYMGAISVLVIPFSAGIWLYRDLVTEILLGAQWREAADFIGLWGLSSAAVLLLGTYCNGLYNARGQTKYSLLTQAVYLAALIPMIMWAAPQGFHVLYVVRSLSRLVLVLVQIAVMVLAIRFPMTKLLRCFVPSVLCTAVMVSVAMGVSYVSNTLLWQTVSVFLCIVAYFLAMYLFFPRSIRGSMALLGVEFPEKWRKKGRV